MEGDGNLLARLFENLLNNAVKYGKDGKIIRVAAKVVHEHVLVQVINYGYVIPKEDLEKLFQKFYREEPVLGWLSFIRSQCFMAETYR